MHHAMTVRNYAHYIFLRDNGCGERQVIRQSMTVMRQPINCSYDPKRGVRVATLAAEYPRSSSTSEHAHGSDQLIFATRGMMRVSSGRRLWHVPPHFGLWIPARVP